MKIHVTSVPVNDQQQALDFCTEKLGFEKKRDIPMGEHRWLTLTEPNNPGGVELLLEPSVHPAVPLSNRRSSPMGFHFSRCGSRVFKRNTND